jgi:hypothetical protein
MQHLLFVFGLVLFLLGLLTGLVVPMVKNPRMGIASYLQGMTNGPFLLVVGLMWPCLQLAHAWGSSRSSCWYMAPTPTGLRPNSARCGAPATGSLQARPVNIEQWRPRNAPSICCS